MHRKVRQGHSVLHQGTWYHQGQVLTCSEDDSFAAREPLFDKGGKRIGDREVDPTEEADAPMPATEEKE